MILTGNWQDALEPIARKQFILGFDEIPSERDMLFDVMQSDKLTETYMEIGDIGPMSALDSGLVYQDIIEGNKMTAANTEYATGIQIQRKFARTDQQDVVKTLPRMLGLAANRRMALDVAFPFNNAFNTSMTTLDGLQLCSTAHTSALTSTTQSNQTTSGFSAVAVEAARIAMTKLLTNSDQRFMIHPDTILVPQDLHEYAFELTSSSGKVDTAVNNNNFHKGRYNVIALDWLTHTGNWFLIDSKLMKQFNKFQSVDPVDFMQAENFDGFAAKYAAYMFYGVVSINFVWIYGGNVN
jgi:phage major head subunit gpT-like protein